MFKKFLPLILIISSWNNSYGSEELIIDAISKHLNIHSTELEVEYNKGMITNPDELSSVKILSLSSNNFKMRLYYAGGKLQDLYGKYYPYSNLPLLKRKIRKGETINQDDIEVSYTKIRGELYDIIKTPQELIGCRAAQDLEPNTIIKQHNLVQQLMVKKDDQVIVSYKGEGLELKTTGFALSGGIKNQQIKIRNELGGKILTGYVAGEGYVILNRY